MMNETYSKLPNILLKPSTKDDIKSICQLINDDRLILIFDYLYINTNRDGESIFSINDIITSYGFKVDRNKGRINDKIKEIIFTLSLQKYIEFDFNIFSIKNNELLKCKINIDYDKDFTLLFRSELNKILGCNDVDKLILLKLYCYLKSRMWTREGDEEYWYCGGKAQVCYPSYELIYNDIGISESITSKYISKLKELKLIDFDNAGVYYHPNNKEIKRESANTYCLYKEDESHKTELKEAIKFFKQQKEKEGYLFIKKDKTQYKNNDRRLNGELGALIRLKNKGSATDKQLKRIEEIKSQKLN